MTLKPWIPPAGEVVAPPVHTETIVDVLFSDRSEARDAACLFNWSGEGDGPKIIAYAVIEEYVEKREPREWWLNIYPRDIGVHSSQERADEAATPMREECVHVREVLPEAPLDLTKITTPFGLLDEATQAALKAHGGPMEFTNAANDWNFVPVIGNPLWVRGNVYRVAASAAPAKPAPRKVVAWAVVRDNLGSTIFYDDEGDAMEHQRKYGGTVRPLGFLP